MNRSPTYRGLHEGRFVIVKELIPASFCPFLTRREDGSIVFDDELSYSHSYLSKIKEKINNAYQHEIDMSHRLRYKGSNNDPRFFSVNEIPTSSASLAKYLAIDTSAGDTLDTYVLNHPQYQPHSPKYDIVACLNLAKEVAYAIGEIHAKGFLHLDVKPSNLFRSELAYMQHGASLIHPIDMGSAVAMLHSGHIDESTVLYGSTPEYASIELHNAVCGESLRRRKAYVARITKATDTYSICKMLSKWLPDENESTMPDPVKRLVYQRIIERGLSIDVKSRFQDTGGLIQALDSAIDVIQRRGIYHLPQKRASVIFELPNQYLELFDKERPFVLVHAWSLSPDNSCAAFFTQNVISYRFEIVDSENVIAKENITGNYSFQSLVWNRKAVTLFCADESSTTISKSLVIHWDGGQFYKRSVEGSLFFPCPQDNHIVLHVTPSNSESGLCRCTLLDLCDTTTRYEFEISREVKGGVFKGRRFDECFDHSDFYGTTTLSIDKMPDAPFYLDQEHKTLFVIAGSRNVYCGKLPENGGTLFLRRYFLGVDAKDIRGCHFEKAETTPETFRFLHMNGGIVPPEFR